MADTDIFYLHVHEFDVEGDPVPHRDQVHDDWKQWILAWYANHPKESPKAYLYKDIESDRYLSHSVCRLRKSDFGEFPESFRVVDPVVERKQANGEECLVPQPRNSSPPRVLRLAYTQERSDNSAHERRTATNQLFLTLCTSLIAGMVFFVKELSVPSDSFAAYEHLLPVLLMVPFLGFMVARFWMMVNDYYFGQLGFRSADRKHDGKKSNRNSFVSLTMHLIIGSLLSAVLCVFVAVSLTSGKPNFAWLAGASLIALIAGVWGGFRVWKASYKLDIAKYGNFRECVWDGWKNRGTDDSPDSHVGDRVVYYGLPTYFSAFFFILCIGVVAPPLPPSTDLPFNWNDILGAFFIAAIFGWATLIVFNNEIEHWSPSRFVLGIIVGISIIWGTYVTHVYIAGQLARGVNQHFSSHWVRDFLSVKNAAKEAPNIESIRQSLSTLSEESKAKFKERFDTARSQIETGNKTLRELKSQIEHTSD